MGKMSKTVDEEMQKLWKQATPEQRYIIVRFMRNIVKPEKTPGARFPLRAYCSIKQGKEMAKLKNQS